MDNQHKLEEIEALSATSTASLTRLLAYSRDADPEIRFRAIERLGEHRSDPGLKRTRDGLCDDDKMVRIACLEIVGDWKDRASLDPVTKCLDDRDVLVRRAAAEALGRIGDPASIRALRSRILRSGDAEKASLFLALYDCGLAEYLGELLGLLESDDYHARCSVANAAAGRTDKTNRTFILSKLEAALARETTQAAGSSLRAAIDEVRKL
ncbi:MAG: HEAT repeat domain-containing protein [Alphaproteobacteria bacterium]|nr:HEAT repeat domain-containing protein [Alphaproteobacteria bacterium]